MKIRHEIVLAGILALTFQAVAQDVIQITKQTTHLIPVSITGFTGEAESVLRFDLSVLGVEVSEPARLHHQRQG